LILTVWDGRSFGYAQDRLSAVQAERSSADLPAEGGNLWSYRREKSGVKRDGRREKVTPPERPPLRTKRSICAAR